MSKVVNWGIIGLGNIAHKFAEDVLLTNGARLCGVASRDVHKAQEFAEKHKVAKYFGSYEELALDAEIDVVYIATPHVFHFENAMMCLRNNKAVLCEKPMGMNAREVAALLAEAKAQRLFLMEGIWTRFIPITEKLLALLERKIIGDILFVRADFGFKGDMNLKSRVYDKTLGGGSLLDIGIYPIYLSLLALGQPIDISAIASMAETEVDGTCSMLFTYPNGAKASLESSIESDTPTEAYIYGTEGIIKLHRRFHHSEKMSISRAGIDETIDLKYTGNGYVHEIEEVNNCIAKQLTESPKLPLATSLDLVSILDRVREKIGLVYEDK